MAGKNLGREVEQSNNEIIKVNDSAHDTLSSHFGQIILSIRVKYTHNATMQPRLVVYMNISVSHEEMHGDLSSGEQMIVI